MTWPPNRETTISSWKRISVPLTIFPIHVFGILLAWWKGEKNGFIAQQLYPRGIIYSLITLGKLLVSAMLSVSYNTGYRLTLSQGPKGLSIPLNISKRKNQIESFHWYIS